MNFKIERNHCNCHTETCCCDPWNLTYKGEVVARHYHKHKLEYLLRVIERDKKEGNMKQPKLLPCPFCGGEAIISEEIYHKFYKLKPRARCCVCRASTDFAESKKVATEEWNTRYTPTKEGE